MKKTILIFIVVSALVILLFYFSNALIFDVNVVDDGYITPKQFSLKDLFTSSKTYQLTTKGWFGLIITTIGFPALVAWRSTLTKYDKKTGNPKKSFWDRFQK